MVVTLNQVYLQFPFGGRQKHSLINFELEKVSILLDTHSKFRTFSTPGPNNCLKVQLMRVFLPAPEGP